MSAHGVQVVAVTAAHSYELDEAALESVLLREEVRDLPVVVVSVAGAYRTGKSFMLNFFLRYLMSTEAARSDGSWLGADSAPLEGFRWRTGIKRTTTGILMWSQPFLMRRPSGEQVAVLLIDTQGTFDSKSTVRDNSTIFALSTLLSSVQIYNVSVNIQEDDLQNLQLFTEYGKLVQQGGSKAFQVLEFLVRDWQFPFDYPFGTQGGNQLLQEKLQIDPELPQEMQDLRKHLSSSFEELSCFLMPHPGFKVLNPAFKGNIADIEPEFRTKLNELVTSLFSPVKLLPKQINGEQVKARDLFNYFKTYMALFTSDEIPNPTSIMKATVKAGLLSAASAARDVYERGMDAACGPAQLSVPAADVQPLHATHLAAATAFFRNKKKMGGAEEAATYLAQLVAELEKRLPQFEQSNLSKIQAAITRSNEAYQNEINKVKGDDLLCVHPRDLEALHQAGKRAAIATFDASRKPVRGQDDERAQFIQKLENMYYSLRATNEQNNKINVSLVSMEYTRDIQARAGLTPPLPEAQFKREHEDKRRRALDAFEAKRSIASHYTEDIFKFQLTKIISETFINMKQLNESKNAEAIKPAVEEYKRYMSGVWEPREDGECLHPAQLAREHGLGLCRALLAFRPTKSCDAGYDAADKDESLLKRLIEQHYNSIKTMNDSANESASTAAYNTYTGLMYENCGFSAWWVITLSISYFVNKSRRDDYHKEAKQKAFEQFDGRRRPAAGFGEDPVRDHLGAIMDQHYKDNY